MTESRPRPQDANCPNCGMPIANGSNPTTRDGVTYCCEGCANGTRCTCPGHEHGVV